MTASSRTPSDPSKFGGESFVAFAEFAKEARQRLETQLEPWLRARVSEASEISEEVATVAEAVAELTLRGGKRVRAALVAAGFRATTGGEEGWDLCLPAMIAVELLQTYLLIHDDWMYDDDVRRGGPAVHVLLRERFGGRAGDAGAVLAGDLASGYAQAALLESKVAPERLLRAARVYARIQVDVVCGQVAEFRAPARKGPPTDVETVHSLKTASYTVTGPLLMGAALGGADDARLAELERFGRSLGIAFQLRDDVLGVFGDPTTTGKPVGNDIRQGKRTSLFTELAKDPRADALLARAFGKPEAAGADVEAIVRAMDEWGARARVESRIRELCDESQSVLDHLSPPIPAVAGKLLRGAIVTLGERSS